MFYIILFLLSFSTGTKEPSFFREKPSPVDSLLQPYLEKFKDMGQKQGLSFKKDIELKFSDIPDKNVIGICHSSPISRSIEISREFYKNASELQRFALLDHELAHGLCGRGHSYGNGIKYTETLKKEPDEPLCKDSKNLEGFYSDGCPTSLMYPFVFSDACIEKHYDEYVVEIYKNCNPW